MAGIPLFCERCSTLRAVEDWRETSPHTLAIALSPCGHQQERNARVEWQARSAFRPRHASRPTTPTAAASHRARSSARVARALAAR
jgi:hypothetical protein